ncbi:MAG: peptidylprolyl isomerase [Nanoarchaeota archaeon]|nr:peptidylprolyl isomerase [Nanoarchaeota archaeon]
MTISEGDKVKVAYEGKLEDGSVFDSSTHGDHSHPLEFEIGSGQVIPGFENAIKGMEKGENKDIELSSENAYGERREDLQRYVPKNSIPPTPDGKEVQKGMVLTIKTPQGQNFPVRIVDVKEDTVTLDLNHPLAGQKLFFKIEILDVTKKGK